MTPTPEQTELDTLIAEQELDRVRDQLPTNGPRIPCLDDACEFEPRYSTTPREITKIPLDKTKYASREVAEIRARQLARKRGLRFMHMFETARFYVAETCELPFKVVP